MIKNVVIWLVKLLKLEEVFLSEFKALLRAKLSAKLSNLENVVHSIENSSDAISSIETKVRGYIKLPMRDPFEVLTKEFNVMESGVKQVVAELRDEIEKL